MGTGFSGEPAVWKLKLLSRKTIRTILGHSPAHRGWPGREENFIEVVLARSCASLPLSYFPACPTLALHTTNIFQAAHSCLAVAT